MIGKNILSEEKRVWFIFGSEITRKKKKRIQYLPQVDFLYPNKSPFLKYLKRLGPFGRTPNASLTLPSCNCKKYAEGWPTFPFQSRPTLLARGSNAPLPPPPPLGAGNVRYRLKVWKKNEGGSGYFV